MTSPQHYETLFHRHEQNPILTAANWPYPAHTVFNAGGNAAADGTTLLLCRVEDRRGHSHLCAARSRNGVDGWTIDAEPTLRPDPEQLPRGAVGDRGSRVSPLSRNSGNTQSPTPRSAEAGPESHWHSRRTSDTSSDTA